MSMNDEKTFRESLAKLLEKSILISYGYTIEEGKYTTIQLQFETRDHAGEASSGGMVSSEKLNPKPHQYQYGMKHFQKCPRLDQSAKSTMDRQKQWRNRGPSGRWVKRSVSRAES